jgi:hypothetical protein
MKIMYSPLPLAGEGGGEGRQKGVMKCWNANCKKIRPDVPVLMNLVTGREDAVNVLLTTGE